MVAAELAGRYDVDVEPVARASAVALAAVSAQHTRLPFDEQIEFFRSKMQLGTETWTSIWQDEHDRAFVVAGAMRDDLLSDLRGAVDQAIADGTTLATFRRNFDGIVAKHGWDCAGARGWRSEVIYRTNLKTSYAAGRYRQMKAAVDRRPYWRYRHSDVSERPRREHVAWDGIVLRHDDPWWDTHYTPNGWGCNCYIEALGEGDLERLGKSGPDEAPPIRYRTVTVGARGPNPRTVEVPEGIDPGWAYAPGRSVVDEPVRQRLERSISQPAAIAGAGVEAMLERPRVLEALSREWREWRPVGVGGGTQHEMFVLGALSQRVMSVLRERQGVEVESASVTITRGALRHTQRDTKARRGRALDDADLDRLPEIVAHPKAVLYDREEPDTILFVFDPAGEGEAGKVVVSVGFEAHRREAGIKRKSVSNAVRTTGYVDAANLRERRYEALDGVVE